ncbi:MAG: hypothetical protein JWO11_115 [Nocardioides sp.]|nr:hypothetical protein [Nocardioides sp.]
MNDKDRPQIEDDGDDVEGHRIMPLADDSGIPRNAADSRVGAPLKDDDEDDVAGHLVRPGGDIPPTGLDK